MFGWWFGTFFVSPNISRNGWLVDEHFFMDIETTNQMLTLETELSLYCNNFCTSFHRREKIQTWERGWQHFPISWMFDANDDLARNIWVLAEIWLQKRHLMDLDTIGCRAESFKQWWPYPTWNWSRAKPRNPWNQRYRQRIMGFLSPPKISGTQPWKTMGGSGCHSCNQERWSNRSRDGGAPCEETTCWGRRRWEQESTLPLFPCVWASSGTLLKAC